MREDGSDGHVVKKKHQRQRIVIPALDPRRSCALLSFLKFRIWFVRSRRGIYINCRRKGFKCFRAVGGSPALGSGRSCRAQDDTNSPGPQGPGGNYLAWAGRRRSSSRSSLVTPGRGSSWWAPSLRLLPFRKTVERRFLPSSLALAPRRCCLYACPGGIIRSVAERFAGLDVRVACCTGRIQQFLAQNRARRKIAWVALARVIGGAALRCITKIKRRRREGAAARARMGVGCLASLAQLGSRLDKCRSPGAGRCSAAEAARRERCAEKFEDDEDPRGGASTPETSSGGRRVAKLCTNASLTELPTRSASSKRRRARFARVLEPRRCRMRS